MNDAQIFPHGISFQPLQELLVNVTLNIGQSWGIYLVASFLKARS